MLASYLELFLPFLLLGALGSHGDDLGPGLLDGTDDLGEEAGAFGPILLLLVGGLLDLHEDER